MGVFLANTDEHDWLACRVDHVECSADFFVDGVKLSQDDAVNCSWVFNTDSKVNQTLVEFGQLVNRVITDESFTHKQHDVGLVDVNEFRQLSHQLFISLHATRGID
jgi:hypothetical protein